MRAITCTDARLEVVDLPDPRPAPGQLLLRVLRCGICGSDLHARRHCDELAAATAEVGYDGMFRSDQSVVLGHEFSGEVLEHGKRTRRSLPAGTPVVAFPLLRRGSDIHPRPPVEPTRSWTPPSSPRSPTTERTVTRAAPEVFELAVGSTEQLCRLPVVPWWRVLHAADSVGLASPKRPVVFECVGVPGLIQQVIDHAPFFSRVVVVVGVCMQPDRIRPVLAVNKEIDLRFVLGYTPAEFRDRLHLLAEGKVRPGAMITGTVGLDGVGPAFTALADPELHAKMLIDPSSRSAWPTTPTADEHGSGTSPDAGGE